MSATSPGASTSMKQLATTPEAREDSAEAGPDAEQPTGR